MANLITSMRNCLTMSEISSSKRDFHPRVFWRALEQQWAQDKDVSAWNCTINVTLTLTKKWIHEKIICPIQFQSFLLVTLPFIAVATAVATLFLFVIIESFKVTICINHSDCTIDLQGPIGLPQILCTCAVSVVSFFGSYERIHVQRNNGRTHPLKLCCGPGCVYDTDSKLGFILFLKRAHLGSKCAMSSTSGNLANP